MVYVMPCHGKELRYIYIEILWSWCCQCNWCSIHDVWKHSAKLHNWHFTIYHSLFWYIISPVFSVFGKGEEVEFFLKIFWRTWVLFVGPLIPLLWTSSDISSGFQSQSGQPYSHLAEAYVLHVPWDSPLVWHLLTSWQPAWWLSCLFHIPVRHWWDSKPGAIMPPLTVRR